MGYPCIFPGHTTPPSNPNPNPSAMYYGERGEIRMVVPKIDRHSMTCPGLPQQHRNC
jgi:hypothetical protein